MDGDGLKAQALLNIIKKTTSIEPEGAMLVVFGNGRDL